MSQCVDPIVGKILAGWRYDISGLAPGTTYHFRALATNFSGITRGPDQAFTTPALPAVVENAATDVTTAPVATPPPPPRLTCKRGFVKRHGKCRKARHRKPQPHRRTHQ